MRRDHARRAMARASAASSHRAHAASGARNRRVRALRLRVGGGHAMKPRTRRLAIILGGVAAVGIAAGLVLNALNSNVAFFFTPTQISAGEAPKARAFRVGGLVKDGTIK